MATRDMPNFFPVVLGQLSSLTEFGENLPCRFGDFDFQNSPYFSMGKTSVIFFPPKMTSDMVSGGVSGCASMV